jgi:hypothetical protein
MRNITALFAASLLLGAPLTALAQDRPPVQADARAEGDAVLSAAGAQDLFDNIGEGKRAIVLRHKASGLYCVLNPGKPGTHVTVFPGRLRGDDVGCSTETFIDTRTFYATRLPPGAHPSLDELIAPMGRDIQKRFPSAQPYQPLADAMTAKLANGGSITVGELPFPVPESRTLSFRTKDTYESVSVTVANGWMYEMRISLPGNMGDAAVRADHMAWIIFVPMTLKLGPMFASGTEK